MDIYSDDIAEASTPPPEQDNASESSPGSGSQQANAGPSGSAQDHAGPSGRPSTPRPSTPPPMPGPSNHAYTPPRRLPWQLPMCGQRPRVPAGVPPLPAEVAAELPLPEWYIPRPRAPVYIPRPPAPVIPAPPPVDLYSFNSIAELKSLLTDRESFVIFSHHGQCFPAIINRKYETSVRVKRMRLVVNSPNEPYTARWEFPSPADNWCSSLVIQYEDIKHVIPPPRRVGLNRRNKQSQFVVPQVDQYWMVSVLPPLRVRVRIEADIEQ